MKLLIVTSVSEFNTEVRALFRKAEIERYSESDIEGFKNATPFMMRSGWFEGSGQGTESDMFFSFTEPEKVEVLFGLIEEFNSMLETDNPVKAVVVPVEKFI
ncbi:MAG: hypothetical protein KJO05_05890 [Bacteroidia bacterium]|nr:hypothetical protein [Bacteroidia bacterium]NNF32008.1 hypothetical protein [Flavobacteriaceae bacterium]MBT8275217.1 hypothetical protein [Bacteroidia bacterium]NNJ83221.1 hypothetical protein [Flavobacteriaceae bacterium]NNK55331.1 hypothetical protein [Flavobacteriaceae bacterium]